MTDDTENQRTTIRHLLTVRITLRDELARVRRIIGRGFQLTITDKRRRIYSTARTRGPAIWVELVLPAYRLITVTLSLRMIECHPVRHNNKQQSTTTMCDHSGIQTSQNVGTYLIPSVVA